MVSMVIFKMHTVWSDGSGSIEEMARAALKRGYQFIAITDHSKSLKIAGGINEEELQRQAKEIEVVNSNLQGEGTRFQVLSSIELNLTPAGASDMDRSSLEHLDVVLGCFHSSLRKEEDQTERYVSALHNPDIQILGHPRGRVYQGHAPGDPPNDLFQASLSWIAHPPVLATV